MKELFTLMDIPSSSGHENLVRAYILKKIKPYCKDIKVDKFGNIIVHKSGNGPCALLVAHMDEIGLIVKKINNDGTMKVAFIGEMEPITCLNQKVYLRPRTKEPILGVITTQQISSGEEITDVPTKKDLIIDTGLSKEELIKRGIEIGNFVEFEKHTHYLGSEDYIMGKALDDRVGCYILIELIKKIKEIPYEVFFVFTVQEEVGLYGVKTSLYNIDPKWALVIDTLEANDLSSEDATQSLGKGPILSIMDSQTLSNECIDNSLRTIARAKKIGLQYGVSDFGTTEALHISLSKGGIPTSILGIPIRNIHTGIGLVHKRDILQTFVLVKELLKHPPNIFT